MISNIAEENNFYISNHRSKNTYCYRHVPWSATDQQCRTEIEMLTEIFRNCSLAFHCDFRSSLVHLKIMHHPVIYVYFVWGGWLHLLHQSYRISSVAKYNNRHHLSPSPHLPLQYFSHFTVLSCIGYWISFDVVIAFYTITSIHISIYMHKIYTVEKIVMLRTKNMFVVSKNYK